MATGRDSYQILKVLSLRKSWNLVLLKVSYVWSKFFKRSVLLGSPFSLSIEPTTACNLACPECPSGLKQFSRPTGKLDLELHRQMLAQVKKTVFYINYYFQGEPFLHPQFYYRLSVKKKKKHKNLV